jgi:hypothetical protein
MLATGLTIVTLEATPATTRGTVEPEKEFQNQSALKKRWYASTSCKANAISATSVVCHTQMLEVTPTLRRDRKIQGWQPAASSTKGGVTTVTAANTSIQAERQ